MAIQQDLNTAWKATISNIDTSLAEWLLVIHAQLVGFLLPGLIFSALDYFRPAWALRWRKPQKFPTPFRLRKTIANATKNMILGWAIHGAYLYINYPKTLFVLDAPIPSLKAGISQLLLTILIGEGLFFLLHSTMHRSQFLYARVHSIHHSSGSAPTAMSIWYAHIIDHFLFNGLPLAVVNLVPMIYLRLHIVVVYVFSVLVLWTGVVSHCGYYYAEKTVYDHWAHHENPEKNLGAYAVMDWVFGTFAGEVTPSVKAVMLS